MSKASLSTSSGPGSSISLAPETIRIRDALIEKFSSAPLEEMNEFMTMALSNEKDEFRRLGILAARIYVLRTRVANLKEFNRNPSLNSLPTLDTTMLSQNLPGLAEPDMTEDNEAPSETDQWTRIQMTEPGEVNGVRFLAGTIIDAQPQDADKLIRSGKAVRKDMDGNIIDHPGDDLTDSGFTANDKDEAAQVVADDASATHTPDDDSFPPTASNDAPLSDELQEASIAEIEVDEVESQVADNQVEDPEAPAS